MNIIKTAMVLLKNRKHKKKGYVEKDLTNASVLEKLEDLADFVHEKSKGGLVVVGGLLTPAIILFCGPPKFKNPEDKAVAVSKCDNIIRGIAKQKWAEATQKEHQQ